MARRTAQQRDPAKRTEPDPTLQATRISGLGRSLLGPRELERLALRRGLEQEVTRGPGFFFDPKTGKAMVQAPTLKARRRPVFTEIPAPRTLLGSRGRTRLQPTFSDMVRFAEDEFFQPENFTIRGGAVQRG